MEQPLLCSKAEHLVLAGPFGWQVGEAGNSHPMREPPVDGGPELSDSKAYMCDVSDAAQVDATLNKIESDLGVPTVLIHNAVGGAFGSFLEIDPAVLNRNFQINTMGLLYLARRLAPAMVALAY